MLCQQPKDVWDVLRKHFQPDTLANKLLLKVFLNQNEGGYFNGIPLEAHERAYAPISEEDHVVTLLGSLPYSCYSP